MLFSVSIHSSAKIYASHNTELEIITSSSLQHVAKFETMFNLDIIPRIVAAAIARAPTGQWVLSDHILD
jgi:hypothetical protein